jgi:N-acetylglucosamine kinase-like BadF-type ATPase
MSSEGHRYFLGIDVGGTKSHALVADQDGEVVGFSQAGPGNWESVGYDGLTNVLKEISSHALSMAGIEVHDLAGVGMGLAGYDWPEQKQAHLSAIAPLGLACPVQIVNDSVLGIIAGADAGWGISIVSGTGCNCRGWSRDHRREGRVVGGANHWSGEAAGGYDILARAMREVTYEWDQRGPATALSTVFLEYTGAKDLDELIGGLYVGRYNYDASMLMRIFEVAHQGDPQAIEVMRWAGQELGGMAVGVVNQLGLQADEFDVVLIGSIYDGHPAITESLAATLNAVAPGARLVRLNVPPVVGGVLLGMEAAGVEFLAKRQRLIHSTDRMLKASR